MFHLLFLISCGVSEVREKDFALNVPGNSANKRDTFVAEWNLKSSLFHSSDTIIVEICCAHEDGKVII